MARATRTRVGSTPARPLPADGAAHDDFVSAVAIDGTTVLLGARGKAGPGPRTGVAYAFDVATGAPVAKLVPTDARPNDGFGSAVALRGNISLIGAHTADGPQHVDSGAAPQGCITPLSTWNFQVFYRNPLGPCAGAAFNSTNALQVTFSR